MTIPDPWRPDPGLDAALRCYADRTHDEWVSLTGYVIGSFAAYLDQPVAVVWEPIYQDVGPNWSPTCGIRSVRPLGGPLDLDWYAVLGYARDSELPYANLLLFSQDQRLVPIDYQEYLEFEYEPGPDGVGRWASRGWQRSEFDEWDGYRRFTKVCRDKREENS